MNLYFTSAYKTHSCLDRLRELHGLDTHGNFSITQNPHEADAIVFVENTQFQDIGFKTLLAHPLISLYPEKVFMYNEMDRSWPLLHGLYCSLGANLADEKDDLVAFPYLTAANTGIQEIYGHNTERKWLYSFVGSTSHPSREPLFKLTGENARIVDTSEFCTWNPTQTSKYSYQKLYTDTIAASKFILCPRGIGPASLRLYETIEAGRVPVIISDSWVAPPQIDWSFAVRVSESDVDSIPERLKELEPEWEARGEAARRAWESTYAPNHMFNTVCSAIQGIQRTRNFPHKSLRAKMLKLSVIAEQEVKSLLKPKPLTPAHNPTILGKLFSSRKV